MTAGGVVALDLVAEHLLLARPLPDAVLIPGLLDFHTAWNRGVSFSLLWQDSRTGGLLLSLALSAVVAGLAVMAWRTRDWISACGFGLIIGGAMGNLYDRTTFHAVFDFLLLHVGPQPLFVCNLADIAITFGALCLIWESLRAV